MSKSRYLSNIEKEIILNKYKGGESTINIAKFLSRNPTSIQRFLKKQGYNSLKKDGYTRRIQKYSVNLEKFDDKEFSDYWAGFITADGCIYKGKGQSRLILNLSIKDLNHLEKFNIGYPVKLDSRNNPVIDIPSNDLCKMLYVKYNIDEQKTFKTVFPSNVDNHFIRGYFDGDGCFSLNFGKYLSAQMIGTFDFLSKLGEKLPCKYSIKQLTNSEMFVLQVSQKPDQMKKFVEFLYKDSTIWLERKREFEKYLR